MEEETRKAYMASKDYESEEFPSLYRDLLVEKFTRHEAFTAECLQKIFHSGRLSGTKLLDFGCGPTVHRVASASLQFDEIILAEWAEANRKEVEKWLLEDNDALDWRSSFEQCARAEGYRDLDAGVAEIERRIRKTVRKVVHCDALSRDILPDGTGEFDVIIQCRTLEACCLTFKLFKEAVKKLTKYLRKGGAMVMSSILEGGSYHVHKTLPDLSLTEEMIKEALAEAGLELKDWFCWRDSETYGSFKSGTIAIYYCVKK